MVGHNAEANAPAQTNQGPPWSLFSPLGNLSAPVNSTRHTFSEVKQVRAAQLSPIRESTQEHKTVGGGGTMDPFT